MSSVLIIDFHSKSFEGVSRPLEMVFLMDASQGVGTELLDKMKKFVEEQLSFYNVSASGTRISLVTYGGSSKVDLSLKDGITTEAVKRALNTIQKIGGERRIDLGFRTITSDVLSQSGGVRKEARKLVVVLITGPSTEAGSEELSQQINAMIDDGNKLAVLGIGNKVRDNQVLITAVDPTAVSLVPSGDDLSESVPGVSEAVGRATGMSVVPLIKTTYACNLN